MSELTDCTLFPKLKDEICSTGALHLPTGYGLRVTEIPLQGIAPFRAPAQLAKRRRKPTLICRFSKRKKNDDHASNPLPRQSRPPSRPNPRRKNRARPSQNRA